MVGELRAFDSLPGDFRARVSTLQGLMLKQEQVHLEPQHYFAHGTYTRVLDIPAGVILTGKIHRYSCTNMLIKGRIKVVCDEGEALLVAPCVFHTGPNVKKAIVAIEDSTFVNIHPWNNTDDLDAIEAKLIVAEDTTEQEK